MKVAISFKDPDTLIDCLDDAKRDLVKKLMAENGLTKPGAEAEVDERMKKIRALASKFFRYGEYVDIELDDEAGTATVVPAHD